MLLFRSEIKSALAKLPSVIDRAKAFKLWALETQLDKIAVQATNDQGLRGRVTAAEIEAAADVTFTWEGIVDEALARQLDKLCLEYDNLRRSMQPSVERTQAMVRILAKMRSLAPAMSSLITAYKSSASAGSRLAAVAMMQMEPENADLDWLVNRFKVDHPFIFYHSALALQSVASSDDTNLAQKAKSASKESLSILETFSGQPDENTLIVLNAIIQSSSSPT